MQISNIKERNNDEFYTPKHFVERHLIDYADIFDKYEYIYIPFCTKQHDIYKVFWAKYKDKILTTPDLYYSSESNCNDFFGVFEDKGEFYSLITSHKTLVFDNPPFSKFMKIARTLNENKIDWMLYGGTLCGANKIQFGGWDILGRVKFVNRDNWVNVSVFSPLFDKIKYLWGYSPTDNLLKIGAKTLESYGGHLSSSEIVNVCQRGYVLNVSDYRYESGSSEHKFGGSLLLKGAGKEE